MPRDRVRRPVCLAALVLAIVGLGPIAGLVAPAAIPATAANPADPSDPSDPSDLVAPAAETRGPLVVLARTETWVKYLDLVIRVLAVILAWFIKPKPPTPEPHPADRRPS